MQWLMSQPWNGNVRELRLLIVRAVALAPESGSLFPHHFLTNESSEKRSLLLELEDIERARVENALEAVDWNVTAASKLLGMMRTTLSSRMKRLGIKRPKG
jgi:transcriptional regulator of acetoin/glycerol metabolism